MMRRLLAAAALCLASAACGERPAPPTPIQPQASSRQDSRPNIILIVTDDQDVASLAHMPHVQRHLVQAGYSFTNAFVSTSLCCPSRVSMLTGRYAHNHGVLSNGPPRGGYALPGSIQMESSTLATWLQAAGYRTAWFGKYLNGYVPDRTYSHVPAGWDRWFSFIEFDMKTAARDGKLIKYSVLNRDRYSTDALAAEAEAFLRDSAGGASPFFLVLAPFAPHKPATPAARHRGAFANLALPRPASFNEADITDKPLGYRTGLMRRLMTDAVITETETLYRLRLESLLSVDEMVDRVVRTLDETGALGETIIIYTSDNGFLLGEHRIVGKDMPLQEAVRVPLIVRMPGGGARAGTQREHLALNIDLAPTIAAMAGVETPEVDGRSLLPVIRGRVSENAWREAVLLENFWANSVSLVQRDLYALQTRTGTVYVQWSSGERELYDLANDPYQLTNLAATAPPEQLAAAERWVNALKTCRGASCRAAERSPPRPR
jgi:arylsulfatase A-like enzyme